MEWMRGNYIDHLDRKVIPCSNKEVRFIERTKPLRGYSKYPSTFKTIGIFLNKIQYK
jgi:hypothetical protein